ncbi:hypothetical protein HBI70_034530 [Parastagonospora nodorum]|nr:hypothetical protein HBH54_116940 [Parastagonospora nodorum]KAH4138222.1 hypothetical protein HBH45_110660 [Parastagonospora nodorum]KAH4153983.1 hypothetical protein HBH44_148870 [Parastagonospora nodorum]KAH4304098.1 hypothetical protein HBI01_074890 [Parastagonospora nodorum]KAH4330038.1 hypothetical protein HBI00_085030 [Parastagonospora nodorum]
MLHVAKHHVNAKNVCLLCPVCSVWWSLKYSQCTLALCWVPFGGPWPAALTGPRCWLDRLTTDRYSLQQADMDKSSRVLAEDVPGGILNTWSARAAHANVPLSTLHHRARGRRSREAKAQSQQYLTPCEENAVVESLLHISSLGQPVRMKYVASPAFSATRHRALAGRPQKAPGVNWAKALERRRPEIVARKKRAQDWSSFNIYNKVAYWFEVIEKELQNVPLKVSMPNYVKILVGKEGMRESYRGARVKRTTVTAIECISADGSGVVFAT